MLRMRQRLDGERGFTLVELLITIVIMGVLSAVVLLAVAGIGNQSKVAACKSEMHNLRTASGAFFTQHGRYASDFAEMKARGFLASLPTGEYWTANYDATTGSVTSTPDCAALAG